MASSLSRRERHGAYSALPKIFLRSRGLDSSCHESMFSTVGSDPAMNGAWAAAAIWAMPLMISTSGAVWLKW